MDNILTCLCLCENSLELVVSGSGTRSSDMLMANLKATSIHIMRLGEKPDPGGSKRHMESDLIMQELSSDEIAASIVHRSLMQIKLMLNACTLPVQGSQPLPLSSKGKEAWIQIS